MRKSMVAALIASALAGCTPQGDQVRSRDGQVVGTAELREITPGESPISVDRGESWAARYSQRAFGTRTSTFIRFQSGSITFEVSGTNAAFGMSGDTSTRAIDQLVVPNLARQNIAPEAGGPVRGRNSLGAFALKRARNADGSVRCAMFEQYPDALRRSYDNGEFYMGYLVGVMCAGGPAGETIETETRRLLDALRYDGGALNRAQARVN